MPSSKKSAGKRRKTPSPPKRRRKTPSPPKRHRGFYGGSDVDQELADLEATLYHTLRRIREIEHVRRGTRYRANAPAAAAADPSPIYVGLIAAGYHSLDDRLVWSVVEEEVAEYPGDSVIAGDPVLLKPGQVVFYFEDAEDIHAEAQFLGRITPQEAADFADEIGDSLIKVFETPADARKFVEDCFPNVDPDGVNYKLFTYGQIVASGNSGVVINR